MRAGRAKLARGYWRYRMGIEALHGARGGATKGRAAFLGSAERQRALWLALLFLHFSYISAGLQCRLQSVALLPRKGCFLG